MGQLVPDNYKAPTKAELFLKMYNSHIALKKTSTPLIINHLNYVSEYVFDDGSSIRKTSEGTLKTSKVPFFSIR